MHAELHDGPGRDRDRADAARRAVCRRAWRQVSTLQFHGRVPLPIRSRGIRCEVHRVCRVRRRPSVQDPLDRGTEAKAITYTNMQVRQYSACPQILSRKGSHKSEDETAREGSRHACEVFVIVDI